ncbi:MAG: xylulokinase [Lachnospiraceae bacterium]
MRYLLGIDLGTSGTKTVLFDEAGKKIASSTVEYDLIQPKNGWAEQDPDDWWNAAVVTTKNVLDDSGVNPADIKGVGISGQMHGLVMVDENGKVIRNAILWCDGRTSEECAEITQIVGKEKLIEITANPALTGFTAGKILWVRKHEPENYAKCKQILLPKDYIRYKLTGLYGAEVSDASGTNLFDITTRDWSDEVISLLDLDRTQFPKMAESVDVAGTISPDASVITGLSTETIVCYGGGDNASAAIGTGVVSTGKAFTTIGTSGVIFAHADMPTVDKGGRVHTFCSSVPGGYTVMSCTLSAGLSLKWFRDNFCTSEKEMAELLHCDSYDFINQGVKDIEIGADKLLFLPYLMGERSPVLDEKARGVFFGLSAIHTKYHMARAVMEGVMYSQKHCLDVIHEMGVFPKEMYACGGGAKSEIWRQMMADMYDAEVITNESEEGPALGVAIMASVACGIYENVQDACVALIRPKNTQAADKVAHERYMEFYNVYQGMYASLQKEFAMLSSL